MRRYSIYIVLLLRFLLPLQVVAGTLLSTQDCPTESVMAMDMSSIQTMPDCCDEPIKATDCSQMQDCHGCNITCQLFTAVTPTFYISSYSSLHTALITPALGLFDPASVWRPPTNS